MPRAQSRSFRRNRPAVAREIEFHAREGVFLLEEEPAAKLGRVDRRRRLRRRADALHPGFGRVQILDLHAEMIEAIALGVGLRVLRRALPADNSNVEVAVGEIDLAREVAVAAPDFLQAEG